MAFIPHFEPAAQAGVSHLQTNRPPRIRVNFSQVYTGDRLVAADTDNFLDAIKVELRHLKAPAEVIHAEIADVFQEVCTRVQQAQLYTVEKPRYGLGDNVTILTLKAGPQ